jgi:hypothetical protein
MEEEKKERKKSRENRRGDRRVESVIMIETIIREMIDGGSEEMKMMGYTVTVKSTYVDSQVDKKTEEKMR